MKPLGLKQYKHSPTKHKISGADRKRGYIPWWQAELPEKNKRLANKKSQRQKQKLKCNSFCL